MEAANRFIADVFLPAYNARFAVAAAEPGSALVNPANTTSAEFTLRYIPEAARAIGLQTQALNASTSNEIDTAFATLVRERADALFVAADAFFISRRVQFATLAARDRIPAAY